MKIVIFANSYTQTAVPYIEELLKEKVEITGIFLLKRLKLNKKSGKSILKKIRISGISHIILRLRQIFTKRIRYLLFLFMGKLGIKAAKDYHCIEELLLDHHVPSYRIEDINSQTSINILKELKPDIVFVCTLSQIISQEVLEIARFGCINIHAGLLPKYRGPASNFWVLFNEEKKTGVTFHYIKKGIDDGDIILQKELDILTDDTEYSLDIRLARLGAKSIKTVIDQVREGTLISCKQSEEEASYYPQPNRKQRKLLAIKKKNKF